MRETQRGAVAGRVILTVGPGAEIHGARLVAWLERALAAANPGTEVYVHPYSLPRPLFFELPAQGAAHSNVETKCDDVETIGKNIEKPERDVEEPAKFSTLLGRSTTSQRRKAEK